MADSSFAFDVVIPVYNGAAYVSEAIESVLKQRPLPRAIIAVDDCSTDQTRSVLKKFGDKIKYISHEKNRGLPAARNTGIQAGDSDLIAFLDADDAWIEGKTGKQIKAFGEDPGIGLCYTDVVECDSKLNPIHPKRGFRKRRGEYVFSELFLKAFPIPPSTAMVRRRAIDVCGLFDESMLKAQDYECWLRIAMKFPVSCIPEALCLRRNNPNSITNTSSLEKESHYTLRAFDLCARAALKWNIQLPLNLQERKRLYFYRRLCESIKWHNGQAEIFFRGKLSDLGGLRLQERIELNLIKAKEKCGAAISGNVSFREEA
jgi:glycosyltransferase involved in cell wall biosynthesis